MQKTRLPWGSQAASATLVFAALLVSLLAVPRATGVNVTVAILEPKGGEVWSAGSVHAIVYHVTSDSGNPWLRAEIAYGSDTSSGTITVSGPGMNGADNFYNWTLPTQDLTGVSITVCAYDVASGSACDTSPKFTIDGTPPALTSRFPQGANVGRTDAIEFHLSEAVNLTATYGAFAVSPDPGGLAFTPVAGNGIRVDHASFRPGVTYGVSIGCAAVDLSDPGLPLADCPVTWTFTTDTPPSIDVSSPRGEVWTGGHTCVADVVAWDQEDAGALLQVYVNFSADGTSWTPVWSGTAAENWSHGFVLPVVNVTTAVVQGQVIDSRDLKATATSLPFTIDSTPPTVVTVNPQPGTTDVGWWDPVVATLSEPVSQTYVGRETLGLVTDGGDWAQGRVTWDPPLYPTQIRFTPSAPYFAGARYTVHVNGTYLTDVSIPGNPVVPRTWTFQARDDVAPTVDIRGSVPAVLSGGSTWTVNWSASDVDPEDNASVLRTYVEFSDGGPFVTLAGPLPATSSYSFAVPSRDVAAAALRVRVIDSQGFEGTASVAFAIDATRPAITARDPAPGASDVPPNASVVIAFSEPVTGGTDSAGLRDQPTGAWVPVTVTWDDAKTLRLTPASALREGMTYEVVVNGTLLDSSSPGNAVAPTAWTFVVCTCPPVVTLVEPAPGIRWTAGHRQPIRAWVADAQDPSVTMSVDLAPDGITFAPLVAPWGMANGLALFTVIPPLLDASNAILRVCATDWGGSTTCATRWVVLDANAPSVLLTSPPAGALRVLPEDPIVLTFSESMNPASVESSLSMDPPLPLTFRWARAIADDDTLIVEHARLQEVREYVVTLGCAASDVSIPGLSLSPCPLSFSFTTAASPWVRLLFPIGGERLTGGADQTVRWRAGAEDAMVRVTVDLSFDGGATFPARLVDAQLVPTGDAQARQAFPSADTGAAVVRVTVSDSLGQTATATSGTFAIDSTPPRILSSSPTDGATNTSPVADIVVVFSESMLPVGLDGSVLSTTPPLRDAGTTWSSTNAHFDTVEIAHAPFYSDSVSLVLNGVRDASSPGNVAAFRLSFSVFLDHEAPHIKMRVTRDATKGQAVLLDAADSTDNVAIADVTWTIRDATGFVVDMFPGARVTWKATKEGPLNVTVEAVDFSGNAARSSVPLYVHGLPAAAELPPNASVTLLGWLALAGAGGSSSYGFTDRGRSFLSRTIVLPLYVRLKPEAVLNNETRGMIRGYILVNPGDCYTDIKRNLGLSNGELAYHLRVLEREGIVQSTTRGSKRVYYPADVPMPENGGGLREIQRRLLRNVAEVPGMSVRDIAGVMGVSSQLALYHVRKLGEDGLVRFERQGMRIRVYATDEGERLPGPRRPGNT